MGWGTNGLCFATVAEAAQDACNRNYPFNYTNGASTFTMSCFVPSAINETAGSASLVLRKYTGGTTTTYTQIQSGVQFPSCDATAARNDLLTYFSAFLAACVVVFAFKTIVLPLFTHMGRDQ